MSTTVANISAAHIMLSSGETEQFLKIKNNTGLSKIWTNRIKGGNIDALYAYIGKTPEMLNATYTLRRQTAKTRQLVRYFQADIERRAPVTVVPLREYEFRNNAAIAQQYQALVSASPKVSATKNNMKNGKIVYSENTIVANTFSDMQSQIRNILTRQDQRFKVHVVFVAAAGKGAHAKDAKIITKEAGDDSDIKMIPAAIFQMVYNRPNFAKDSYMTQTCNTKQDIANFMRTLVEACGALFVFGPPFAATATDMTAAVAINSRPILPVALLYTTVKIVPIPKTYLRGGDFDMALIKKRFQQTGYNDNLCFWRAMTFKFTPKIRQKDIHAAAKNMFYEHFNVGKRKAPRVLHKYLGFNPDDEAFIKAFEDRHRLCIELVQFDSDKQSTTNIIAYRRSRSDYSEKVYLLKENNHVMYIKDINKVVGMFECERCGKYMASSRQLAKHQGVDCSYRLTFPKHDTIKSVVKSIGSATNCNNFLFYDFESRLPIISVQPLTKTYEVIDGVKTEMKPKTEITRLHIPISFSIASGVSPEPVFVVRHTPNDLVAEFFTVVCKLCREIHERSGMKTIPVFGYNSQKYDMNLIMDSLIISVEHAGHTLPPNIRKGNNYMTLSINVGDFVICFRDIRNHLPPCTFDAFTKAYGCKEQKAYFPYDILMENKDLKRKCSTIALTDFPSDKRPDNLKEYMAPFETLGELLKYYNNLDVSPGIEAIRKMHVLAFEQFKNDIFTDVISISSMSKRILFMSAHEPALGLYLEQQKTYTKPNAEFNLGRVKFSNKVQAYTKQDADAKPPRETCLTFEATQALLRQSTNCHYCGCDVTYDWSLDRIDNAIGHINSNVLVACWPCNNRRGKRSYDDFIETKALEFYDIEHPQIHLISEDNKEVYAEMNRSVVGGASLVFHKYHEADVTRIQKATWNIADKEFVQDAPGKLVKEIIGMDANALYLWCIAQNMPCGELKKVAMSQYDPEFFGFVCVDISVEEKDYTKFAEFPPIFTHKDQRLVSGFSGENMVLHTDLLAWYVSHGLKITKVYFGIEARKARPFVRFADAVSDARRAGDKDKAGCGMMADMAKLVGNSAFGQNCMNKEKYTNTRILTTEKSIESATRNPLLMDIRRFAGTETYECEFSKSSVKQDVAKQIAVTIFQLSKLRMLQFYHDFMVPNIGSDNFQYMEMDTDSAYFAITGDVPADAFSSPEWFVTDKYTERTPGLFKVEARGRAMTCLTSKMYALKINDTKCKAAHKGISPKTNTNVGFDDFKKVLVEQKANEVVNRSFRFDKNLREMRTHVQTKVGLNFEYKKRGVFSDNIGTYPIYL